MTHLPTYASFSQLYPLLPPLPSPLPLLILLPFPRPQCADFFMQRGQYEKAAHLLVIARQFERALDVCARHQARLRYDGEAVAAVCLCVCLCGRHGREGLITDHRLIREMC
jgi:hypothetical protein